MNTYRNYIFMSICESTIDYYKQTNYLTYLEYCRGMNRALVTKNLSTRDKRHLAAIFKNLDIIFSLTKEDAANFLVDFFLLDDQTIELFEIAVITNRAAFPFIGYY